MRTRSILCALAGASLVAAAPPPDASTVSDASVKSQLESDPVWGESWRALRDNYPDEYEHFVGLAVERGNAKLSDAEQRQRGFDEMSRFTGTKQPTIVRAPSADLHAVALAYVALVHALQKDDAGLCARFSTSGFEASDVLSPTAAKAASHVKAMLFHAFRDAETSPGTNNWQLQKSDAVAFIAAVTQANPNAAALLSDKAKLNAASDVDKCATGVAVYDAVASLPEEQAATITAFLVVNGTH